MYKLEIFTDQMDFADAALIQEQTVELDYLTFDAFTLEATPVCCRKGYFVHVTRGGSLVCDGVVSDVQPGDGTVSISVRPLQAMFDCEVFTTEIQDVAAWLAEQITQQFVSNVDTLQNRPVVVNRNARAAYPLATDDKDTMKLLDVMASALTTYGVVCDCRLDMEALIDIRIGNLPAGGKPDAGGRPSQCAGQICDPGRQLRRCEQDDRAPAGHKPGDRRGDPPGGESVLFASGRRGG